MAIGLPEGFELDQPQNVQSQNQANGLPAGFELDNGSFQSSQPQMGRGEAAFITATNPLNFGDEIKAGIAALTAKTFGGAATKDIDIGDLYREARNSERAKLKQAQETYPMQSGAIGFASDIPFEAAALGKAGLTGVSSVPKLAAGGGLLATVGGAGASEKETMGGVVQDALTSGTIGAIAAPALAAAIPAAINMIGKGASAVKGFMGRKTGEEIAQEAISPKSAAKGLEQLKASPEGQPTTALDIDSPEFQALAKTAVSRHPQAKQIAADFAAGRKEEATKRIDNILSKDVSPVDTYFGDFAEKQKLQKARGAENYANANSFIPKGEKLSPANTDPFGGYIFKDKELSNLISTRPDFTKAAAKEAADLAQIEQGIKINPAELLQPSTKNVDMIKKGLDSLIDKETDALGKTSPKGRALEIYKVQLLKRMDTLNPDYGKARNIYAGDFAVQKAQELGRKFDKMQPEEIAIKMKGFGQSEKEAFRVGQRLKLQEMADKSKTPAEKIFGNENVRKQLKASFDGNESKFNEFSQRLKEEASYDKTIKNLGLNKQDVEGTNRGLINMIARVAAGSKTGMVFEGARAAETAMIKNYRGLNDKNAKELIRAFTDKKASIRILENIVNKADSTQKPIIHKAINDIYPSILGATLGYKTAVMSDASAEEPNMSEEQTRRQLIQQHQQYPMLSDGQPINPQEINAQTKQIKQRYYRD